MKRLIRNIVNRFGYVLIHSIAWRDLQLRLHQAEIGTINSRYTDEPELLLDQKDITQLKAQLVTCTNERDDLLARVGRADSIVYVFEQERARLHSEIETKRAQLAHHDNSGRVRDLEIENKRLRQRVTDLEAYLKETRKTTRSFL